MNHYTRILIAPIFIFSLFALGLSGPPAKIYFCEQAEAIVVDGFLKEKTWLKAEAMILVDATTGAKAKSATRVQAVWDSVFLYLSYATLDNDLVGSLTGHDEALISEEGIGFFSNFKGDKLNYEEFQWNNLNASKDVFYHVRGSAGISAWSATGMISAASISGTLNNPWDFDWGMTAEIAIPWKCFDTLYTDGTLGLFLPPREGDTLRVQPYRFDRTSDNSVSPEISAWAPVSTGDLQAIDSWGAFVISNVLATGIQRPFAHENAEWEAFRIFPAGSLSALRFQYEIRNASKMSIAIYSLFGKTVRKWKNINQTPGTYSIIWGGKDDSGRNIAGGMYLIQIENGQSKKTIQCPVLR